METDFDEVDPSTVALHGARRAGAGDGVPRVIREVAGARDGPLGGRPAEVAVGVAAGEDLHLVAATVGRREPLPQHVVVARRLRRELHMDGEREAARARVEVGGARHRDVGRVGEEPEALAAGGAGLPGRHVVQRARVAVARRVGHGGAAVAHVPERHLGRGGRGGRRPEDECCGRGCDTDRAERRAHGSTSGHGRPGVVPRCQATTCRRSCQGLALTSSVHRSTGGARRGVRGSRGPTPPRRWRPTPCRRASRAGRRATGCRRPSAVRPRRRRTASTSQPSSRPPAERAP